jgi:hypothetical protein
MNTLGESFEPIGALKSGSLLPHSKGVVTMKTSAYIAIALLFAGPAKAQSPDDVAAIKPAASELKWQRIPWVLDLARGAEAAKRENRPIFLWVTGDDPLERC